MRIAAIEATDLFLGPASAPRQVVRVTLSRPFANARVRVEGPTVRTPTPAVAAPDSLVVEVGVLIAAPAPEGSVHRATVIAETGTERVTASLELRAAETGWTMWMISHFHYDPVWWNTQRGFTELWQQLADVPFADRLRPPFVRTAFDLVRAHLDAARHDDDYRFVLAEIDYLKPYWDVFVDDRADLRRMLREGRVELVGGTYNEPNTNLTHPESTIRNAVYGVGYQRDVLGGDPRSAWMLDAFGHDPAFPGLMADAGLTSSAWARGPFHHVGVKRHTGDVTRMQFPSEFEWLSPTGRGLLTAYLANHYVAGWDIERRQTLDEAIEEAYAQYRDLRKVAATRNVLLPVGHDHNIPSRWCTEIHREWPRRYVWPRFVTGLPRDFFAAVRSELAGEGRAPSPQTRDMNPVYTGKDVSYIDTKQAQREVETAVLDAERLGTLAALLGDRFPAEALDRAWRLLAYGAHHDAVTGTESDQVYLDLLGGWREAHDLAVAARRNAIHTLAAHADTRGDGQAVLVVNPLSWQRDGIARTRLRFAAPGPREITVRDDDGADLPAVAEGMRRHDDGTLAEVDLSVAGRDVPALGYRVWHAVSSAHGVTGWTDLSGTAVSGAALPGAALSGAAVSGAALSGAARSGATIANAAFECEASPGGALHRILDRRTGRELLRPGGLGGEITVQEEYPAHPRWSEGPWHLLPKGPGDSAAAASVRAEASAAGQRLVSLATLGDLRITREVILWRDAERIDFRTHVDGSIGRDRLLRVRFDLDLPGALPVSEVGFAAIGRAFGFPEADTAEHLWTLDNPARTWAGLSATVRIRMDGAEHAIGVAEVISDGDPRDVLVALARQGVTATFSRPGGPRYGALDADSNLPDVRIVLGPDNSFAEAVLASAGDDHRSVLAATGRVFVPAARPRGEVWVPGADLRGDRDLPALIVADPDALAADLDDAVIEVRQQGSGDFTDYSVALVNHGTPGFVARPDGTLFLSLMRACTGWPSGVWIDGPRRTTPDGAGFQLQHWSHTFRYSLVAGPGDWRRAGFVRAGQELNHPLLAAPVPAGPGTLPRRASLASVSPDTVVLTALKPRGNPLATGGTSAEDGVTLRMYESSGAPCRARVRLLGGLREPAVTNVLEEDRPAAAATVATDGDDVTVDLAAADVVTVTARPGRPLTGGIAPAEPANDAGLTSAGPAADAGLAFAEAASDAGLASAGPATVFTRYWLHNDGPAPLGNLPVSVHVHPTAAVLPADVRVTVGSATAATAGTVTLDVPEGLAVSPVGPYPYDLSLGGHHHIDLRVTAEGAAPGQYHLAAQIRDPLGQVLEDVVTLTAFPDFVPADLAAAPTDLAAVPADLVAALGPADVVVAPGGTARLTLRLHNPAASPVRGRAQLLSPHGTWDLVSPSERAFTVPAAGDAELDFTVTAPAGARPGARWWALAKVTGFGQVVYTAAVPLGIAE